MTRAMTGQRVLREHARRLGVDHEVEEPLKVRVGLGLGAALTAESFWTVTDTSEEVGLDSLWFAERLGGDQLAPLAAMAAAVARTSRLRIGTSALILPGRDPVQLAKEIATIDQLSNGRIIPVFGLVSPHSSDRRVLRVPHGAAGRWADEALTVMRRLWAGQTIDHDGEFFDYAQLRIGPRTADSKHLDVWTGGHSRFAISRAGRLADGWLPSFLAADAYQRLAKQVIEVAGSVGRSWDLGHFGMVVPYVPRGATERAGAVLAAMAERLRGAGDVVVTDAGRLSGHILDYVEAGASKFVAMPIVAPPDWAEEIGWLQHDLAGPLRDLG